MAEPVDAKVILESAADGDRPVTGSFSSCERDVVIRFERDGYYPQWRTVRAGSRFKATQIECTLFPIMRELRVTTINGESAVYLDGEQNPSAMPRLVAQGAHEITLRREGFADQTVSVTVDAPVSLTLRHQKDASDWSCAAVLPTGRAPKQVTFTPDGRYLVVTLLDDDGFDLIDLEDHFRSTRVVGPESGKRGYVESMMCPEKNSFWVSQMTTNAVYEYSLPSEANPVPLLLRSVDARGVWTKVMAVDPAYRWLAVANWVSNSVSILDYATGDLVAKLGSLSVPRGLAFSPDGAFLYIASYEGSFVRKYDTATWKAALSLSVPGSAMRHIALSADGGTAWVSDMAKRSVYRFDTDTMKIDRTYAVESHPNTIALSPDGKRLFVSCRGPNNPVSYYLRSPVDGAAYVFNLETDSVEAVLRGGNQPTGLAVSPDGGTLVFTNFLDNDLEVYRHRE